MAVTVADLEAKLTLNMEQFQSALGRLDSMIGGTMGTVGRLAAGFGLAQVGLNSLEGAFNVIRDTIIGFNSEMERATLSFTYLTGGADQARAHIAQLVQMAENSPFPTEQYFAASRALQGLGMNTAFVPGVLARISDAAAGMGVPLDVATQAIGRFMSMIARGDTGTGGLGMAGRGLMSMGLISGPFLQELSQMQQAGASVQQILDKFIASLGKFDGASAAAANTWSGLMTRIKDTLSTDIGTAFQPLFAALEELAKRFKAAVSTEEFRKGLQTFVVAFLDGLEKITLGAVAVYEALVKVKNAIDKLTGAGPSGGPLAGVPQHLENITEAIRRGMPISELATSGPMGVSAWLRTHGGLPAGENPLATNQLGGMSGDVQNYFAGLRGAALGISTTRPEAGGVPGVPGGNMFGAPPGPALKDLQEWEKILREAAAALSVLNPFMTETERKSEELAAKFLDLEAQARKLPPPLREIAEKALPAMAQQAQDFLRQWDRFRTEFEQGKAVDALLASLDEAQPHFASFAREMDEFRERVLRSTEGMDAAHKKTVMDYAEAIIQQKTAFYTLSQELERADTDFKALARDMDLFAATQAKVFDQLQQTQREGTIAGMAATQQAGILRAAGVQGVDLSGQLQANLQSQIQALTQQRATAAEELYGRLNQGTLEASSGWADTLRQRITDADLALAQLQHDLGRLQEINTLKSITSDVFGALNRAVSTSITGIIQGTTTASKAFENMGQSILLSIEEIVIKRAFKEMEEAFFSMLDSMIKAAAESGLWQAIISAVGGAVGGFAGGGVSGGSTEIGGITQQGAGVGQAGGIVTRPTWALIGERHPEALIPLDRMPGASPLPAFGDGGGLTVVVNNYSQADVSAKQSVSPDGRRQLEVLVQDTVRKGVVDGSFDRAFQSTYGLSRQGTRR